MGNIVQEGYEPGQHCNWIVRSPLGTRIQAEFLGDFSLLCATICLDYVELKLAKDQRLTGARFCCGRRPEGPLISEHNQIVVFLFIPSDNFPLNSGHPLPCPTCPGHWLLAEAEGK
jgi:hypothetical protein